MNLLNLNTILLSKPEQWKIVALFWSDKNGEDGHLVEFESNCSKEP
jgi:hypothetical protein